GDLLAEALLGVVDRDVDELAIVEQESDQPDRAVLPALDVMNAVLRRQDNFIQRRAKKFLLDALLLVVAQRFPDQIRALRDTDQPRRLGERLRRDMPALAG